MTDRAASSETADAVAVLVDSFGADPATIATAENVADLAGCIARSLSLDAGVCDEVAHVAIIGSVGLRTIGSELLDRPEPLSDEERERLCRVPMECAAMAARLEGSRGLAGALRAQRERWDGSGYPDGLRGDAIPISARIFAVADAWEALRSPRPFRPALSDEQAIEVLARNSGSQFWPQAVTALLELVQAEQAPRGSEDRRRSTEADDQPSSADAAVVNALFAAAVDPGRDEESSQSTSGSQPPAEASRGSDGVSASASDRRRGASVGWMLAALAGLVVGVLLALPLPDVSSRCPPAGEGLVQCQLQKSVLPAVTIVIGCVVGALVLRWMLLDGIPRAYDWSRRDPSAAQPRFDDDPVLAAANWGLTYEDAHPERRIRRGRRWQRQP